MDDYIIAQLLQEEYDNEIENSGLQEDCYYISESSPKTSQKTCSIVDEKWELLDPNPDIRQLFLEFNSLFFNEKLSSIEVKWSPRMTLCAGLCCYEGYGGLCSIRLSLPLLKLRSRKDLVETLLHEMIHAYLFVTHNNKDRSDHGPEFLKLMNKINKETGSNITVYHKFHDEVDLYRQHWWRCNGPCQKRNPYFGYVKRATNRAPSKNDYWWAEHQLTCGGTYTKIKEPEGYLSKRKKGTQNDANAKRIKSSKSTVLQPSQTFFIGKGYVLGGSTSERKLLVAMPSTSRTKENQKSPSPVSKEPQNNPNHKIKEKASHCKNISSNSLTIPDFFHKESIYFPPLSELHSDSNPFSKTNSENISKVVSASKEYEKFVMCPLCQSSVLEGVINEHVDTCLQNST